ncbi:MAG: ZPR1 zinc finger domain-containing protein [Candidatus Heimdallarchaeum endolithica]|uniref:ZPR1 zinc finger domain-containing protein n=1 Tax=Candidatus Heimdallarchaeum endolithica TaxID=2876572 RepID=A0A9Y1FMZ4_9ARCH|nr:MAG: ZPR1 zinc finger domain-containing protein [Candidatus Heimdallarchaeum endolithica]
MTIEDIGALEFDITCPSCKSNDVEVSQKILNIPHFSKVWLYNIKCNNCGYKHNDMLNLESKEATRYIYRVENAKDYTSKIVRSANGTVRIPELGVLIEPGPSSTGFINNIEGVLQDVKEKVLFLLKNAQSKGEREKIIQYINQLNSYIERSLPLTFIIEDPLGNSLIVPYDEEKLTVEILTEEEASKLKTGYLIFSTKKS